MSVDANQDGEAQIVLAKSVQQSAYEEFVTMQVNVNATLVLLVPTAVFQLLALETALVLFRVCVNRMESVLVSLVGLGLNAMSLDAHWIVLITVTAKMAAVSATQDLEGLTARLSAHVVAQVMVIVLMVVVDVSPVLPVKIAVSHLVVHATPSFILT